MPRARWELLLPMLLGWDTRPCCAGNRRRSVFKMHLGQSCISLAEIDVCSRNNLAEIRSPVHLPCHRSRLVRDALPRAGEPFRRGRIGCYIDDGRTCQCCHRQPPDCARTRRCMGDLTHSPRYKSSKTIYNMRNRSKADVIGGQCIQCPDAPVPTSSPEPDPKIGSISGIHTAMLLG